MPYILRGLVLYLGFCALACSAGKTHRKTSSRLNTGTNSPPSGPGTAVNSQLSSSAPWYLSEDLYSTSLVVDRQNLDHSSRPKHVRWFKAPHLDDALISPLNVEPGSDFELIIAVADKHFSGGSSVSIDVAGSKDHEVKIKFFKKDWEELKEKLGLMGARPGTAGVRTMPSHTLLCRGGSSTGGTQPFFEKTRTNPELDKVGNWFGLTVGKCRAFYRLAGYTAVMMHYESTSDVSVIYAPDQHYLDSLQKLVAVYCELSGDVHKEEGDLRRARARWCHPAGARRNGILKQYGLEAAGEFVCQVMGPATNTQGVLSLDWNTSSVGSRPTMSPDNRELYACGGVTTVEAPQEIGGRYLADKTVLGPKHEFYGSGAVASQIKAGAEEVPLGSGPGDKVDPARYDKWAPHGGTLYEDEMVGFEDCVCLVLRAIPDRTIEALGPGMRECVEEQLKRMAGWPAGEYDGGYSDIDTPRDVWYHLKPHESEYVYELYFPYARQSNDGKYYWGFTKDRVGSLGKIGSMALNLSAFNQCRGAQAQEGGSGEQ